jgi:flagellin
MGIQSVDTSTLGGTVGRLYEIGSGNDADLTNNTSKAGQILQAALNSITSLRGQLGAFQTATIDTNISTLTSAVTNLTAAQSSIQDADFASESANLSREQILVQSGTTVAGIASSTPANVLSLLQKAAQV